MGDLDGVCASSGGMFNNYAIVQGVDHIVPVDIYLPGCPPRPEMLIDSILKLHDKIINTKLGKNRDRQITEKGAGTAAHTPAAHDGPRAGTGQCSVMAQMRRTGISGPRWCPTAAVAPSRKEI